jgi:hypothetical protein
VLVAFVIRAIRLTALMMEQASTCETSVNFYQAAQFCYLKDSHIHTRRRENLKTY